MKKLLTIIAAGVCGFANAAVTVSNVSAQQRYPWNGLVDITYTISGDVSSMSKPSMIVTAKDNSTGITYLASTFISTPLTSVGTHTATWNPALDGLKINSADVTFTITISDNFPLYCLINISGGSSASSYPVTYLNAIPSGGWTNNHRLNYIVMRYCPPGTYMMQGSKKVTLTKPFYIGIFEITQGQYKKVMGSSSSYWNMSGDYYPTAATYSSIRGVNNYPTSTSVGSSSFVGKLMSKTSPKLSGIDLPTEAQWEYACRAGTTGELSSGKGLTPNNVKEVAGFYDGTIKTDIVGSHAANPWGIYDMHGNAPEMCLDFYVSDLGTSDAIDPKGASSGTHALGWSKNERVTRGCGWEYDVPGCLPEAVASYSSCARGSTNCQCGSATCGKWHCAFRICMTLSN